MDLTKPQEWIKIKEAAAILNLSYSLVYRLKEDIDPLTGRVYLGSWQPSPGCLWINHADVMRHKIETKKDPDFWRKRKNAVWIPNANGVGGRTCKDDSSPLQRPCTAPNRQANQPQKSTRQLQPSDSKAKKPAFTKAPSVQNTSVKPRSRFVD